MKPDLLNLFKDMIWKPDDYTDYIWMADKDEILWNTDNNIEDLLNSTGNTYSSEQGHPDLIEREGYLLITLGDWGEDKYQAIFDNSKRVYLK